MTPLLRRVILRGAILARGGKLGGDFCERQPFGLLAFAATNGGDVVGNVRTIVKNLIAVALILAAIGAFAECERSLGAIGDRAVSMSSAASDISSIASVGGKTLDEAYYGSYGSYLGSEAVSTTYSATILARGVELLSALSFLGGLYMLLVVRIEPSTAALVVEETLPVL